MYEERYSPMEMGREFLLGGILGGWIASGIIVIGDLRDIAATITSGDLIGTGLNLAALLPLYGDSAKVGVIIQSVIIPYHSDLQSSSRQATIGKSVPGLIVTDTDGRRLTFWRASLRYIGRIIAFIPLCLGFLLIIFTEKKQGLHDFIADTVVIRKKA